MARREAPVLSRGSTALKEQWLRHLARHPLSYWRGTKKRDYGVPGAAKNTGAAARPHDNPGLFDNSIWETASSGPDCIDGTGRIACRPRE